MSSPPDVCQFRQLWGSFRGPFWGFYPDVRPLQQVGLMGQILGVGLVYVGVFLSRQ